MKRIFTLIVALLIVVPFAIAEEEVVDTTPPTVTTDVALDNASKTATETIVVYYLHGNRRCATCQKLEAYSHESITANFADLLKDSSMVWKVMNFEEEGNEHFVEEYQLYSQSVVLSRLRDGKETAFKNLDKIWALVGDKDKFLAYIETETKAFLVPVEPVAPVAPVEK